MKKLFTTLAVLALSASAALADYDIGRGGECPYNSGTDAIVVSVNPANGDTVITLLPSGKVAKVHSFQTSKPQDNMLTVMQAAIVTGAKIKTGAIDGSEWVTVEMGGQRTCWSYTGVFTQARSAETGKTARPGPRATPWPASAGRS